MASENHNAKQFDLLKDKYEKFRSTIPDKIAIQAVNFFKRNFELQGFVDNGLQKWKPVSNPKERGRKVLSKRGTLKRAIKKFRADRNKVVIGVPGDVKYAAIHNEGGSITITSKMRRYFWAMFKQTKQEYWRNLALTKKDKIIIPQRQFIGDSQALTKNVDRMIARELKEALK